MGVQPLMPDRIRRPRGPYGWVDLRPVTHGHLEALDSASVLVYLFLCAVGNSDGVSFWGRSRISRVLHVSEAAIAEALVQLRAARLIVFRERIVQVLPVPETPVVPPAVKRDGPDAGAGTSVAPAPGVETTGQTEPVEPEKLARYELEARLRLEKILGRAASPTMVRDMACGLAREARQQEARGDKGSQKP